MRRWARIRTTPSIVPACCWITGGGEAALRARPNVGDSAEAQAQAEEVKRESYGIELGVIQDMYEAGDITRAQSKQLRRNVYVMSVDADAQI